MGRSSRDVMMCVCWMVADDREFLVVYAVVLP